MLKKKGINYLLATNLADSELRLHVKNILDSIDD